MSLLEGYSGIALTWGKVTPGNTVTGIPEGLWKYKELEIGYDSGDYTFLEGDIIVGVTSGAIGVVRSFTVTSGTIVGTNAAGKIRFHSWNGVNFTNNEKIKVAADVDVGDIDGSVPSARTDEYPWKDAIAVYVLACAAANGQRIAFSGRKVLTDQTSAIGMVIAAGDSFPIGDASAIKNINVVDATAGQAGSTTFIGYF